MTNYIALYRKYRPKTFDEITGQKFITQTLKNIIKNNKISHSYLFIGPRGTGKTSTAKIFAKTINCVDIKEGNSCEACLNCLMSNKNENVDIIEMDAASNNGVDEIREIKNHISLMPSNFKYKIYIIDEVHMLSQGAFNALLKTLEEPPEHVIFILATTDPQKIPLTIKSRCQIFEFESLHKNLIAERLKYICEEEKIKIDDKSINLIAENSNGGLRDAIGLLDQLSSYTNSSITENDVLLISGKITEDEVKQIIEYIISNDFNNCFKMIDELEISGKKLNLVAESIINYLKKNLIQDNNQIEKNNFLEIILNFNDYLLNVKNFSDKRLMFDLTLFKCFKIFGEDKEKNKENKKIEVKSESKEKNNDEIKKEIKSENLEKNIEVKENNDEKKEEKKETKNEIKETSEETKDFSIYKDLMNIRINNVLLKADKLLLKKYTDIFKNIQSDVSNLDELKLINLLQDCNIKAGSEEGILISVDNENLLEELYENIFNIEQMFDNRKIENIKICFILDNVWKDERIKYIEKIKNNELKYMDETDIIQSIKNPNSSNSNEFESLLEIGD